MNVSCLHRSKVKTRLETAYGEWVERIPAWIKWATQVLHLATFELPRP